MALKVPRWVKGIISSVLISIFIAIIFGAYLHLIGVPKTKARTYYNFAQEAITDERYKLAEDLLQQALDYWHEPYIAAELQKLRYEHLN